ncbi:hypothetical protein ACPOL_6755 (plasmid) [Acidisarcina polymorpha]|uniref:Uncharacterized protein n=1 Tax=Acidisarcina polymorpha TaxID=2211140 RepID=A0A2Z5GBF4_9BACT|nr:hypothetical protein [Acidisarcina polymorpha]AXC15965.1 hypothetical protein ACPOL_6755 [Acidisarcina polymorpha]
MKKPKDVAELASRLANAATTPLVVSAPAVASAADDPDPAPATQGKSSAAARRPRRASNRSTVAVFLRVPEPLFEHYDEEAVRRTKATGRGVTVQQVMLDRLENAGTNA